MGVLRVTFPFTLGTVFGMYVAQNFDVPNVERLVRKTIKHAKKYEEVYTGQRTLGSLFGGDKDDHHHDHDHEDDDHHHHKHKHKKDKDHHKDRDKGDHH